MHIPPSQTADISAAHTLAMGDVLDRRKNTVRFWQLALSRVRTARERARGLRVPRFLIGRQVLGCGVEQQVITHVSIKGV
jgi:hypothetical protein